jgi:type I restriction enzyme S subunit
MANPRGHNADSSGVADLPQGWAEVPLGALTRPSALKTEPSQRLKVFYLGLEHIESWSGRIIRIGTSSEVKSTKAVFKAGDILYGKLRPYLNKVAIPDFDGICSTDILVFPAREGVQNNYLRYVLSARGFVEYANHRSSGIQLPRVNFEAIADYPVPLPPVAEQKRIVAKVEDLLALIDAALERVANVPAILKRFRQSVLSAACSGRLTAEWRESHTEIESGSELLRRTTGRAGFQSRLELPEIPDCWIWAALPWLGELNRGKSRHRPRNALHLFGGSYPFIQTGDVARSGGRIIKHSQTYSEEGLKQSRLWPEGTVCITIAANIADSGILTYKACFPDSVVGFIADSRLCSPEFVEFFIRTARENLSAFAPETTQKNINLEILREVAVPLPPLEEQREIVRRVEALFKLADAIEKRVVMATARAEKLTQSILSKAFRGELVPTEAELARREGREYEPASVLLERIRASRDGKAQKDSEAKSNGHRSSMKTPVTRAMGV